LKLYKYISFILPIHIQKVDFSTSEEDVINRFKEFVDYNIDIDYSLKLDENYPNKLEIVDWGYVYFVRRIFKIKKGEEFSLNTRIESGNWVFLYFSKKYFYIIQTFNGFLGIYFIGVLFLMFYQILDIYKHGFKFDFDFYPNYSILLYFCFILLKNSDVKSKNKLLYELFESVNKDEKILTYK
jgi:hypothetical protein